MNSPHILALSSYPKRWSKKRAKFLFPERDLRNIGGELVLSASQRLGMIPQEELEQRAMIAFKGIENFKLVCKGDFVISLRSFQGGIEFSNYRGVTSPAYTIMAPAKDVAAPFFRFYLKSDEFIARLNAVSSGIRDGKTIRYVDFRELELPVPPAKEAHSIAAFLDYHTAKIDELIEKQERLIALLEEKRQAVISHAVTKGLNPDAPMKDSGVEWLGQVPAHWETPRIAHLSKAQGGSTPSKERADYWEGDIPWVTPKDMKQSRISDSIDHITTAAVKETGLRLVPLNSILLVVRGMILAHSFPVAITEAPVTINQDMKALSVSRSLIPDYFLLLLQGLKDVVLQLVGESAHGTKKLEWETFQKLQIPLPPIHEQAELIRSVSSQSLKFDRLLLIVNQFSNRLREHRAALISAAVTGKIDVRGWKPDDAATEDALLQVAEEEGSYG